MIEDPAVIYVREFNPSFKLVISVMDKSITA